MPAAALAEIATEAAEAYSPGNPDTRRARAYAAWYLRRYIHLRDSADPEHLPDHETAMATYGHEIGG